MIPQKGACETVTLCESIIRKLLTADVEVIQARDGNWFVGLDYSTFDITDEEAAYLESIADGRDTNAAEGSA